MQEFEDLRNELEKDGYILSNGEFESLLKYAKRKAKVAGKDESYLPLLLPDVIREYFFRACVTGIGVLRMEGANI